MLIILSTIESEEVRSALAEFYELHKKKLFFIANDILHDSHEAEDVIQTAFIKFVKYFEKNLAENCHKNEALIVIIVRNIAINIYKKRQNHPITDISILSESLESDIDSLPEVKILNLEKTKELSQKLAKLNKTYSEIIYLRYLHEYSFEEIAEILGINQASARQRLHRAKLALKQLIEKGNYDE